MKKFTTLVLLCILIFSMSGCTKKTTEEVVETYPNDYKGLYETNIVPLDEYVIYTDVNSVNEYYKDKDYPGNKQYLNDVKDAYKDSKEKIQAFVNGLKNDTKTNDEELKKMNDELIAQGEESIKDIDNKISQLDKISESDYTKSKDEFIKLVNDTVKTDEKVTDKFKELINNMNKKLGIDTNNKK